MTREEVGNEDCKECGFPYKAAGMECENCHTLNGATIMFARTTLEATVVSDRAEGLHIATLYSSDGDELFSEGFDSATEATDWLWQICKEHNECASVVGEALVIPRVQYREA